MKNLINRALAAEKKLISLFVMLAMMSITQMWAGLRGDYTLVTDVKELTGGGTFIIASIGGYNPAIYFVVTPMRNETSATTSNTGYMYSGATSGSTTSGTIDLEDDELDTSPYEVTIETGNRSGTIAIKLKSGTYKDYYISFSNTGNHDLKMSSTKTDNASFTPTYSSSRWQLLNYGQTSRYLRYWTNSSNYRFTNAGSTSTGAQWLVIYKKSDCTPPSTALTITSSSSVTMGSTLSLTTNSGSGGGNGGTITWSVVAGTGSATVTGSTLTPVTPGTVTVKASQPIYDDKCGGFPTQTVTINKRTATIVLSEAGAESSVSGTHYELDEYTLPTTAASCGTKVLVGWSTVTVDETDTKPSSNYYAKGASATLHHGENKFYAVYATATPGAGDWEKYTAETVAEGDYLLYNQDYVMQNDVADGPKLGHGKLVSISNNTITYGSEWAASSTWHIAPSSTYYTIKNGSNYVIATGSASQADLSSSPSSDAELFTITRENTTTNNYIITSKVNTSASVNATLKRGSSGAGAYFACYGAAAPYVSLFKRGYGYSAYSTDCCEPPATALSITSANTVAMGNTITLASTGGNGGSITWTVTAGSGNGSISAGVFTPSSAGTVTIKAHQDQNTVLGTKYCAQDVEQEVTITVNTTGVEVDPTSKAIVVDETFTITPTVAPADATDKTVSWSSSAEGKASVTSAGLVTGVAAGSATITCTTTNGSYTADCAVTVYGVTLAVTDDEGTDISATIDLPLRSGINITPAANANNYVFDHWTLTNATLGSSSTTEDNTITSPTGAVTVTAVYLPGVEIRWYVNGEEWTAGNPSTSVESGTQYKDLTYPTDPTPGDACGNRFVGWTDHSMGAASGQSAPTPLLKSGNDNTTAITTAKEFHAVFADYAN